MPVALGLPSGMMGFPDSRLTFSSLPACCPRSSWGHPDTKRQYWLDRPTIMSVSVKARPARSRSSTEMFSMVSVDM
jgi:hypothetical protein